MSPLASRQVSALGNVGWDTTLQGASRPTVGVVRFAASYTSNHRIQRFCCSLVGLPSKNLNRPTPALWFGRLRSMTKGQIYKCPNPDCFCEVTVFVQPANGDRPRCRCGAEMKKPYTKPVLTSLKMAP